MKSLVKKRVANVRLSQQQAVDLERAAKLESARRGEIIGESTLLRELAMPRVREILQGAEHHMVISRFRGPDPRQEPGELLVIAQAPEHADPVAPESH